MSFGLQPQGFVPMAFQDVFDITVAEMRAALGQNIRSDVRSVLGQVMAVLTDRDAELWSALEDVYTSSYPPGASDVRLDDLLALAAASRQGATFSAVALTITGTPGHVVGAGFVVSDGTTDGVQWITTAPATIGGGGSVAGVNAQPAAPGAIIGLTATLTHIVNSQVGVTAVTNPADAVAGRPAWSNATARQALALLMRYGGGGSPESIESAILRLAGVTECVVIENEFAYTNADGMPPNSTEVVVRGGDLQTILNMIWMSKVSGGPTFGNSSGTVIDRVGDAHTVYFSRPALQNIYCVVDYTADAGFNLDPSPADSTVSVDESLIRDAILAFGATSTLGRDAIPWQIEQRIEVPNIRSLNIRIGLAANPAASLPITLSRRQLAVFDSTRVAFNRI